jgi:3-isopropylmalate/(R)-2-methylmalate dehydratase small subunit
LAQLGVRALIGTSFGGIFFDNCARNGLLAVELPPEAHALLLEAASDPARLRMTIDLQSQTIASGGLLTGFEIEPSRRQALLDGLDAVGATLARAVEIRAFETRHLRAAPWLNGAGIGG